MSTRNQPTREFTLDEFKLYLLGKQVTKCKMVSYRVSQQSEYIPTMQLISDTLGVGPKNFSVQLELLQSEYEALYNLLQDGQDLTDLEPFDIVMTWVPKNGGLPVTRRIVAVKITEDNFTQQIATNQTGTISGIAMKVGKA